MPAGSARDGHVSGRRQNDEAEPFLVQQIPGSPVHRGRRHNSEEERFLVEDMPGSPVMRGRVPRVIPSTTINAEDTTVGRFASASTYHSSHNSTSDTTDGSRTTPASATMESSNGDATRPTHYRPSRNDDAPPSYESSIPPAQVGWRTEVISTVPFPVPYASGPNGGRSSGVFFYPPADAYPPIGLSPLGKSYQSLGTPKSRSPVRSTSPSLCPSPDRFRPAYTYQHTRVTRTPPPRPRYRVDDADEPSAIKPQNDFSYKYGAIVIAIAFVTFLMLLSLAVKFLVRNSFRQ